MRSRNCCSSCLYHLYANANWERLQECLKNYVKATNSLENFAAAFLPPPEVDIGCKIEAKSLISWKNCRHEVVNFTKSATSSGIYSGKMSLPPEITGLEGNLTNKKWWKCEDNDFNNKTEKKYYWKRRCRRQILQSLTAISRKKLWKRRNREKIQAGKTSSLP